MTQEDQIELAEIEAAQADVKARRKRFFAKLRQRALRERRRVGAVESRTITEHPATKQRKG